mmetsp:Transcript_113199/g.325478  ORF Transcript_113199/g.325478 Transcript_113199/m.325478 type:complete len:216 (+) Transcript_113199:131-778(+)
MCVTPNEWGRCLSLRPIDRTGEKLIVGWQPAIPRAEASRQDDDEGNDIIAAAPRDNLVGGASPGQVRLHGPLHRQPRPMAPKVWRTEDNEAIPFCVGVPDDVGQPHDARVRLLQRRPPEHTRRQVQRRQWQSAVLHCPHPLDFGIRGRAMEVGGFVTNYFAPAHLGADDRAAQADARHIDAAFDDDAHHRATCSRTCTTPSLDLRQLVTSGKARC